MRKKSPSFGPEASRGRSADKPGAPQAGSHGNTAFLLSQVGGQSALRFAELLAPMDLAPPEAGILFAMGNAEGLSQRALARRLGILPSRLVVLIDALERKGLVERHEVPDDRRTHALRLTDEGRRALDDIREVSCRHEELMCAALSPEEKEQLKGLLSRIAAEQSLSPGVHPGYRRLGRRGRTRPC